MRQNRKDIEHTPERGMLLMLGACFMLPAMDALAKLLSLELAVGQVAFLRFACQAFLLLLPALMLNAGWREFRNLHRRAVRKLSVAGMFAAAAILCLYWGQANMPLANAIAIFFAEPLLLTLISALVLKESVGLRRYIAVMVGLGGALLVIRPNWVMFGPVAVLPLLAALFYAAHLATIRSITASLSGLVVQVFSSGVACVFLGFLVWGGDLYAMELFNWKMPSSHAVWLLLGMGVMAAASHLMITLAFKYTRASILAPFQYLEIFSATILGYYLFGDFPDLLTWAGTAVILGAGCYVFYTERRLSRG